MNKLVKRILALEPEMQNLSNEDFKSKTKEFKMRLVKGEKLDNLLPEAYALVREASYRMIGLKHFPVQLLGGIELNKGKIAQLATGEGKTLVATLPVYLNALQEKGCHIITVNDYLAKRDAEWMYPVYELLGLSVGYITSETPPHERKKAYSCDVTYVTNSDLGFDYLRDHLVLFPEQQVQRGFYFAVVDEADSVFIDEARTPLIISQQKKQSTVIQKQADEFVKTLTRSSSTKEVKAENLLEGSMPDLDGDYVADEKNQSVVLTENGIQKAESFFGIKMGSVQSSVYMHCIELSLKANYMFHKDVDYIIRDGEICIVDEHTGRVMPDRRYSDGLHQALEAKEKVEIKQDDETVAMITYQSLFKKYRKLSGMTGTIATERKEIKEIYNLRISVIPTNKPVIREDLPDKIYAFKKEKYTAILNEIKQAKEKGQPVLVGTSSVNTSEEISNILDKEGIVHQVLNAKNHSREAEIISHAGKEGAITIATNMAGRGTDIKLSKKALEAGGLYVIGAEKHESRRIDNQLRGRSGRQGDPGKTQFYVSLEDKLLSPYINPKLFQMAYDCEDGLKTVRYEKMYRKAVVRAQKQKEIENFGIRKNVFDYDKVNHRQMEIIYNERDRILHKIKEDTLFSVAVDENNPISVAVPEINIDSRNRQTLIRLIDKGWMDHLYNMEELKRYASLKGMGQSDPLIEYKLYAYKMFEQLMDDIKNQYRKVVNRADS